MTNDVSRKSSKLHLPIAGVVAAAMAIVATPGLARACANPQIGSATPLEALTTGALYSVESLAATDALYAKILGEAQQQAAFWGTQVPAGLYYYDDAGAPNAFAWCGNPAAGCADGFIALGVNFVSSHLAQHGEPAIVSTMAHEWGHRVQEVNGWFTQMSGEARELEADAFAGYYMARAKGVGQDNADAMWIHVQSIGNYYYESPDFHGTPGQRQDATKVGVYLGQYDATNSYQHTYEQMHAYFVNEVTRIMNTNE